VKQPAGSSPAGRIWRAGGQEARRPRGTGGCRSDGSPEGEAVQSPILHLLGLDHARLSYCNNGIERRLADVHGHVIEPILG